MVRIPLSKAELIGPALMICGIALGQYGSAASVERYAKAVESLRAGFSGALSADELGSTLSPTVASMSDAIRVKRFEGYGLWLFLLGIGWFVVAGRLRLRAVTVPSSAGQDSTGNDIQTPK